MEEMKYRTMQKTKEWLQDLDMFDIAHLNASELIRIEDDKKFLINQRQPGTQGYMSDVDYKPIARETRIKNSQHRIFNQKKAVM